MIIKQIITKINRLFITFQKDNYFHLICVQLFTIDLQLTVEDAVNQIYPSKRIIVKTLHNNIYQNILLEALNLNSNIFTTLSKECEKISTR